MAGHQSLHSSAILILLLLVFLVLSERAESASKRPKPKEGAKCHVGRGNICNHYLSKSGKDLYDCCNSRCINVLGHRAHCGSCQHACRSSEHCCGGKCTNFHTDPNNCGGCGIRCSNGENCEYGICGYGS
ncbi:hypothetical protein M569_14191 [Genlisea aurea]|uniref:Stigma-specific Stig1 family protein n=1 Tax=Genlisea aurea TaxID=192259 RepID=S8DCT0_9LAMI|nr:hypothetical protein M569_14191 [Genlisea aurea]